ncbi:peptide ABC transporter ATP-binding protein [Candidatus Peregrinibacteria bacterium CG_4_10_14_0_2_um_filter_38_24]|nr:MAG: peptide ABC transporter ATP-binding protein [Candidatus Peregrinibacteria bacterium CG_4_10_14_0_2_um_filter_38_24]PJC39242.1 MAG: peptide ABC transporter ATP-binding protein [Candidatus Peregrinibacteria bacterium CG_4_9_14_0_2_um_filter_38_9]
MIVLQDVYKKFSSGKSKTDALINVNIKIKEGEFVAITGPSGSGKTTLLNIIGGLDSPTKGKVFINDFDLKHMDDDELSHYRNKEIGFIFQEFHLEPFLKVRNNILLPTLFDGHTHDVQAYADALLKEVKLVKKSYALANELSGGEKQRTAIARALINKPKIIIADEPTGNLDQETGEAIITLLKNLQKTHNITLIIATHDKEIARLAKRIIHIEDGIIKRR